MPEFISDDNVPPISARMLVALLRDGVAVEFVALGASMWPTIRSRAEVRVEPARAEDLRIGEVGAFESERGAIILHRFVARRRDGSLVFRGDGFGRADRPVPPSAVLGRVHIVRQPPLRVRVPTRNEWLPLLRAAIGFIRRRGTFAP